MDTSSKQLHLFEIEQSQKVWQHNYDAQIGEDKPVENRSGLKVKPIYSPLDWDSDQYNKDMGFPGVAPFTRGIYPTMHRGRTWTQRQLIGLGRPQDYNKRVLSILKAGASAISLIPCNSGFRGIDCDEVPLPLLGTCGTVINTTQHMADSLKDVPYEEISTALNDPSPFTLFAFLLSAAKRRGVPIEKISGTSNQSDYISHCVANHMFFRLSLSGARRVLLDHIEFCSKNVPKWNPVSVVGQHIQQAGATPAEAMAFTLSTAIQYAEDCIERGMNPDDFLPRFTFFFDISISFFEEIAKFRAGRKIWARLTRDRFGAKDPRSWRFKFHGQTSGADLTMQQPLNNIARVGVQAMAGIFGGLQSLHTDSYDEAITTPSEETAKIAIATQNILREEAHLCDVIDPLGGSYYVEKMTNQMEEEIVSIIDRIDRAGGMYAAVEAGIIQRDIGNSALRFQSKIENGEQPLVGVNCYEGEDTWASPPPFRPAPDAMQKHVDQFLQFKNDRDQGAVNNALENLTRAANSENENVFEKVVMAADAEVTHGEIIACLRHEMGAGDPIIVA